MDLLPLANAAEDSGVSDTIMDIGWWTKTGASIVAGGAPSWIAAGVVGIGLIVLFFWLKGQRAEQAQKETDEKSQKDAAEAAQGNQDASSEMSDAEKATEAAKDSVKAEMEAEKKRRAEAGD